MKYGIQYDFDEIDEPPRVFIADNGGRGCCLVEVLEEPTCGLETWTRDDDAWLPGPMAQRVVDFLNSSED